MMFAQVAEWVRAKWAEHVEYYADGRWCLNCDTTHREAEACPRQMIRWCLDCVSLRALDRYFRCGTCGSSSVEVRSDYSAASRAGEKRIEKHATQKILTFRRVKS